MTPEETELTLAELADRAGVSERTIRYYIQFGLLPAPEAAGSRTRYGPGHLGRLRLIRQLQDKHLPLNEIRKVLARRSEREIERMAGEPPQKVRSTAMDYIEGLLPERPWRVPQGQALHAALDTRSHWERIRVTDEIELHVRRPLSKADNRRLEELLRRVRDLFPEGDIR